MPCFPRNVEGELVSHQLLEANLANTGLVTRVLALPERREVLATINSVGEVLDSLALEGIVRVDALESCANAELVEDIISVEIRLSGGTGVSVYGYVIVRVADNRLSVMTTIPGRAHQAFGSRSGTSTVKLSCSRSREGKFSYLNVDATSVLHEHHGEEDARAHVVHEAFSYARMGNVFILRDGAARAIDKWVGEGGL
jgi:hypothetical protein